MLEYISYILLLCLGFFTVIIENRSVLKYIYLPSAILFMFIVRLHGFELDGYQKDIMTYSLEMKGLLLLTDFYYLREFVFWFILRLCFTIFSSDLITFIFLDFIWLLILIKICKNNSSENLGKGLIIVLMTSFPFLFGYQNIYRQFYASIILLYSYSIIDQKYNRGIFLFIISIFIHNLAFFIAPLLLIKKFFKFKLSDRIILSSIFSQLIILVLPFVLFLKASAATKFDLSILYLFLFLAAIIIIVLKFKDNIYQIYNVTPSLIPSLILMCGFIFLRQEMIAERIGMMLLIFLMYDLYKYSNIIQSKFNSLTLRLLLIIIFTLPVFFSESSLKFLY